MLPRALLASVLNSSYDQSNEQVAFGDVAQTFDPNGNPLTQTEASGTTTYTWDARNRLVAINGPNVNAPFSYDALGRRIAKTINGQITTFLYHGPDIVRESGGAGDASYLRTLAIDEALVRTDANGSFSYLADILGSTVALADSNAGVATEYSYEPFGSTQVSGQPSPNSLQFTGRENDGTGLYYYRARYYHPIAGRFLQEDPIGFEGGGTNLYAYVANNPIGFVDPMGLACGPGGFGDIFVPDNWFGWYSFKFACSRHDACYGCEGAKAGKSKADCDDEFLRDMLKECSRLQQGRYWRNHCEGTAYLYYSAVKAKGQRWFDQARKDCGCMK